MSNFVADVYLPTGGDRMVILMAAMTLILCSFVGAMTVALYYWRRDFERDLALLQSSHEITQEIVRKLRDTVADTDVEMLKRRLTAIEMRGNFK